MLDACVYVWWRKRHKEKCSMNKVAYSIDELYPSGVLIAEQHAVQEWKDANMERIKEAVPSPKSMKSNLRLLSYSMLVIIDDIRSTRNELLFEYIFMRKVFAKAAAVKQEWYIIPTFSNGVRQNVGERVCAWCLWEDVHVCIVDARCNAKSLKFFFLLFFAPHPVVVDMCVCVAWIGNNNHRSNGLLQ